MERDRPKTESVPDRFPEVTMAYMGLRNTVFLCRNELRDRIISEGYDTATDRNLKSIVDKIADIQKTTDRKYIYIGEVDAPSSYNSNRRFSKKIRGYLDWNNDEGRVDLITGEVWKYKNDNNTKLLESKNIVEYEKFKLSAENEKTRKIRLNIPNLSYPNGTYFPFRDVSFIYDGVLNSLKEKYGEQEQFEKYFADYRRIREELISTSLKIKVREGERIENRYGNIIKCINKLPEGLFLIPIKINCDYEDTTEALRSQSLDIYFFPRAGLLKRVELGKNLKPNFKKTQDAKPSDWFEIGKDMSLNLTDKLNNHGWERPLFFRAV